MNLSNKISSSCRNYIIVLLKQQYHCLARYKRNHFQQVESHHYISGKLKERDIFSRQISNLYKLYLLDSFLSSIQDKHKLYNFCKEKGIFCILIQINMYQLGISTTHFSLFEHQSSFQFQHKCTGKKPMNIHQYNLSNKLMMCNTRKRQQCNSERSEDKTNFLFILKNILHYISCNTMNWSRINSSE